MHGHLPLHEVVTPIKNISGTLHEFRAEEKPVSLIDREIGSETQDEQAAERRCAYIAAETWPPGAPPYCGAPVRPGSAYCPTHAQLCTTTAASREGQRVAALQDLAARAAPPPELDHLAPLVLAEPIEPDEGIDARELLPTARHEPITDEEEA